MRPACVIFDCDGTLVDSEHLANGVFAQMLIAEGLDITEAEATNRFRGLRLALCLEQVEAELGRRLPDDFVPEFRRLTAAAFTENLRAMPGAKELVRALTAIPVPFCVASSGPRAKIELSLSLTGLLPYFEGRIFSSYEISSWKPEPGLFLHASQELGVEPAQCLVVEDSLPGIEGAIAARMPVYAFQPETVDPRIPADVPVFTSMPMLQTEILKNLALGDQGANR